LFQISFPRTHPGFFSKCFQQVKSSGGDSTRECGCMKRHWLMMNRPYKIRPTAPIGWPTFSAYHLYHCRLRPISARIADETGHGAAVTPTSTGW